MTANHQARCITLLITCLAACATCQETFPEWRGSARDAVSGAWLGAPIVAVGDVTNVRSYGEQLVERLAGPVSPDFHKLYWCVGDFKLAAVVKGELPTPPKRYLWASVFPGCSLWLWPDNPKAVDRRFRTRVWFLREEGAFLRPAFDIGRRYIGLFSEWKPEWTAEPRRRLGLEMLTPSANADTPEEFSEYFGHVFDMACDLLGRFDCTQQLQALSELGRPALREVACGFLEGEFQQHCRPK